MADMAFDVMMIGPFPSDATRIEGGVQASLYGLASELARSADIAELAVIATPKRRGLALHHATVAGIDVTFLDAPFVALVSMVLRLPIILRRIAAMHDPVVHLHGSGVLEAAVVVACRLKKIPLVWTLHGITEKELRDAHRRDRGLTSWARWLLYAACERLQLKLAPQILVDTPYVAREIAGRAAATPLAIPQGIFPDEMAAARNPDRRAPLVVSLGVIHPRKGHVLAITAFAEVVRAVPEARLVIVGSLAEPTHLAELQATVARLGLGDRVEIRVDQPRDRVLAVLAQARVYALHSQEESQGIALCEAMAAGLPIVATRVGGIPDVIGGSGAGLLVDYGDTAAFADALIRVLRDDDLHAAMCAAAIRRSADFDWAAIARRVVAIYRTALAHRPRPAEVATPGADA